MIKVDCKHIKKVGYMDMCSCSKVKRTYEFPLSFKRHCLLAHGKETCEYQVEHDIPPAPKPQS